VNAALGPAVPALAAATNRATRAASDSLAATLAAEAAGAGASDASLREAIHAVEMLDGALGLHDELLERRSGAENGSGGPVAGALAGAWLLGRATDAIAGLGDEAAAMWGSAAAGLVRARILAFEDLYDAGRTPERYLTIAEMRSGGLLSLAARLGALLCAAGAPRIAALDEYGRALGVAVEIRADVVGVREQDGPGGQRIGSGDYPLPLLYAIESEPQLARLLGRPLDGAGLVPVLDGVRTAGGVERAVEECHRRALAAASALEGLDDVDALREIAERVTPASEASR
jgi:geranylgeranyl diphosphate synthase type I